MAFQSNGPITLSLPPFRGVTRRIILIAIIAYLTDIVLGYTVPEMEALVANTLMLHPDKVLHPLLWQLVTYPFLGTGLISIVFALISVWFFGAALEEDRGSRWLSEYFLATTIGGALLATLLALSVGRFIPGLSVPETLRANGLYPFSIALVVAYGVLRRDETINFNFIFKLKAKYLAMLYVAFYLLIMLFGGDRFGSLVVLMNALAGYVFLRLAPRRGLRVGASERWFGIRNAYYRSKRRRAAKKFTVYMRKQGKEVSLDADGRYIDPNGQPHDPSDRRWMN